MIIPKEDEIRFDLFYRHKKILKITQDRMRRGESLLNCIETIYLRLIGSVPFDFLDILIAGDDNKEITSFRGFREEKLVTGVEVVEGAEDEDFHPS